MRKAHSPKTAVMYGLAAVVVIMGYAFSFIPLEIIPKNLIRNSVLSISYEVFGITK